MDKHSKLNLLIFLLYLTSQGLWTLNVQFSLIVFKKKKWEIPQNAYNMKKYIKYPEHSALYETC